MTVSNAFSRPDQLSAELREKILATAGELGYVGPDPAGRALARGTTGAVGVLLTESLRDAFSDEIATSFLGAIVDELAPTGVALTLLTSNDGGDIVPARDVAMDGAFVYSCRPESDARGWLLRRKIPLVFVDQDPVPGFSSVNVADRDGARAAAQHLVELGHRRVAMLITPFDGHPQRQRVLGWRDAVEAAGIASTVAASASHADEDVAEAARRLLSADPSPTAVLCFSDTMAAVVVRVARDLGLAVPTDLSVVGFDDSPVARRHDPPLTTVRQDVAEKGRVAAGYLRAAIDHARTGTKARARRTTLPTELVVRQSTAPPPR
jgi:DNA-binding LacI/PurR family transcriptional regulator